MNLKALVLVCVASLALANALAIDYPFYNDTFSTSLFGANHTAVGPVNRLNHSTYLIGTSVGSFAVPLANNNSFSIRLTYNATANLTSQTLWNLTIPNGNVTTNISLSAGSTDPANVNMTYHLVVSQYLSGALVGTIGIFDFVTTYFAPGFADVAVTANLSSQTWGLYGNGYSGILVSSNNSINLPYSIGTNASVIVPYGAVYRFVYYDTVRSAQRFFNMTSSDCYDLVQDNLETGIDTGGACPAAIVVNATVIANTTSNSTANSTVSSNTTANATVSSNTTANATVSSNTTANATVSANTTANVTTVDNSTSTINTTANVTAVDNSTSTTNNTVIVEEVEDEEIFYSNFTLFHLNRAKSAAIVASVLFVFLLLCCYTTWSCCCRKRKGCKCQCFPRVFRYGNDLQMETLP